MDEELQDMLMQPAIVVNQQVELSNVLIGIDAGNKYSLHSPTGQQLGQSAEVGGVGGFIMRQIFRNARSANVKVFGNKGTEIAEMRKPFNSFSQKLLLQLVEQKLEEQSEHLGLEETTQSVSWEFLHYNFKQFIPMEELQV